MEGDYSMLKIFPMQSANKRVTGGVVQHYVSVVAFKWKRRKGKNELQMSLEIIWMVVR